MKSILIGMAIILVATVVFPVAIHLFLISIKLRGQLIQLAKKYPIPDSYKTWSFSHKDTESCHLADMNGSLFLSEKYWMKMDMDREGILLIGAKQCTCVFGERFIPYWIPKHLLSQAVPVRSFFGGLFYSNPHYVVAIAEGSLNLIIHHKHISHPIWQVSAGVHNND